MPLVVADLASVLVLADEGPWSDRVRRSLVEHGFAVTIDGTGDAVYDERGRAAGAAIVDLGLRARSAIELLMAWRVRSTAPILAIGNSVDEAVVVGAYEAGADHVAHLDITVPQLLARLRSLMRRQAPPPASRGDDATTGLVRLDAEARTVQVGEALIVLSRPEFDFVQLLVERSGRLVGRAELRTLAGVDGGADRSVDFFVRRVRQKLEQVDGQRRIQVVRGVGFRFVVDATAAAGSA